MDKKWTFNFDDKRVQYLITTDEKLKKLIKRIGNVELEVESNGFRCLVKYIIGQQISDKARETIWKRLCKLCGNLTPVTFMEQSYETLRSLGLSSRKIEYMRILSNCLIDGIIELKKMETLSNKEIINKLISIKGIGRWTAEMYLIFGLGRLDVLSPNDGTIRRSIQWMYNLEYLPREQEVMNYFKKWKSYETIVALYFWKSISLGLQKIPFNDLYAVRGGVLYETES